MTNQLKNKAYRSWVAIDIAKDYNVVMVELTDGKTRRFRMANSGKDHDCLIEVIRELPQPSHIGFEATGNYHCPLAYRLLTEGFEVSLILFRAIVNSSVRQPVKRLSVLACQLLSLRLQI